MRRITGVVRRSRGVDAGEATTDTTMEITLNSILLKTCKLRHSPDELYGILVGANLGKIPCFTMAFWMLLDMTWRNGVADTGNLFRNREALGFVGVNL